MLLDLLQHFLAGARPLEVLRLAKFNPVNLREFDHSLKEHLGTLVNHAVEYLVSLQL